MDEVNTTSGDQERKRMRSVVRDLVARAALARRPQFDAANSSRRHCAQFQWKRTQAPVPPVPVPAPAPAPSTPRRCLCVYVRPGKKRKLRAHDSPGTTEEMKRTPRTEEWLCSGYDVHSSHPPSLSNLCRAKDDADPARPRSFIESPFCPDRLRLRLHRSFPVRLARGTSPPLAPLRLPPHFSPPFLPYFASFCPSFPASSLIPLQRPLYFDPLHLHSEISPPSLLTSPRVPRDRWLWRWLP
ncbi:hypothetical protein DFH06DRAFT_58870 [Mycena polygramma]|nr:hypothetical protein DFH06DRAFT_58870 [Mycena polygramma]